MHYQPPGDDSRIRERQATIEERLRNDMRATLTAGAYTSTGGELTVYPAANVETLLEALVSDAMHQIDLLLREVG